MLNRPDGSTMYGQLGYEFFSSSEQLRGGRPILDFHGADNFHIQVTTRKAMNFQEDVPSIPIDIFIAHFEQKFDLTSIHYAAEIFLPRTSWKSFEVGAKLYFFTRMR